jgi:hypothetical protein
LKREWGGQKEIEELYSLLVNFINSPAVFRNLEKFRKSSKVIGAPL